MTAQAAGDNPQEPASTRLPAELRLKIWKHYFNSIPTPSLSIIPPLCHTNRLFRREALPIYLERLQHEIEKVAGRRDRALNDMMNARDEDESRRWNRLSNLSLDLFRTIGQVKKEIEATKKSESD